MNEVPRHKLRELVARFGPGLCEEAPRCEAMLRDVCPEYRREIFVLVAALKERVVADLRVGAGGASPREALLDRLTHRLVEHLALAPEAARWAVESWALALGVVQTHELGSASVMSGADLMGEKAAAPVALPVPSLVPAVETAPLRPAASPSEVATLVVSQLGRGQFTSIGRALQAARPGDRILVGPGRYLEGLLIDRPVEIVGDGARGEVVIESADADCVTLLCDYAVVRHLTLRGRGGAKNQQCSAIDVARGRLVVEDCDITSEGLAGIAIHGAKTHPVVRRCRIHDGAQAGVMVYDGAEATIEDCELAGNAAGLVVTGGAQPVLRGCRIHGGKTGVYAYGGGAGLIEDCTIFGHSAAEVQIRQGANPLLRRCKIRDGQAFGVYVYEEGLGRLEECDIFGCTQAGVVAFQGGHPTLRRCLIHDGAAEGIYVLAEGRGQFEECDVFGQRRAGVALLQTAAPLLLHCKIHDGEAAGIYVSEGARGQVRECEIFRNAGAGIEVEGGGDPEVRGGRIHDGVTSGVTVRQKGRGTFEGVEIAGNVGAGLRVTGGGFPVVRRCRIHGQPQRGVLVDEGGQGLFEDCDISDNEGAGVESTGGGEPSVRGCRVQRNGGYGVVAHAGGAGSVEGCDLGGNRLGPFHADAASQLRGSGNRG